MHVLVVYAVGWNGRGYSNRGELGCQLGFVVIVWAMGRFLVCEGLSCELREVGSGAFCDGQGRGSCILVRRGRGPLL